MAERNIRLGKFAQLQIKWLCELEMGMLPKILGQALGLHSPVILASCTNDSGTLNLFMAMKVWHSFQLLHTISNVDRANG